MSQGAEYQPDLASSKLSNGQNEYDSIKGDGNNDENGEFLCSVKERGFPEDFSSLGCSAVLGKGGEWVMTTTADDTAL